MEKTGKQAFIKSVRAAKSVHKTPVKKAYGIYCDAAKKEGKTPIKEKSFRTVSNNHSWLNPLVIEAWNNLASTPPEKKKSKKI